MQGSQPGGLLVFRSPARIALAVILLSPVVGYVVAGRALRPIARITAVAQDIQNTDDLSRRIGLAHGGKIRCLKSRRLGGALFQLVLPDAATALRLFAASGVGA